MKFARLLTFLLVFAFLLAACSFQETIPYDTYNLDARIVGNGVPAASFRERTISDQDKLEEVISGEAYSVSIGQEACFRFCVPVGPDEELHTFLAFFDEEGHETRRFDLAEQIGSTININGVGSDSNGNILLFCHDSEIEDCEPFIQYLSANGTFIEKKLSTNLPSDLFVEGILGISDGSFYIWGAGDYFYLDSQGAATKIVVDNAVEIVDKDGQASIVTITPEETGQTISVTPLDKSTIISGKSRSVWIEGEVQIESMVEYCDGLFVATSDGVFTITDTGSALSAVKLMSFSQAGILCSARESQRSFHVFSQDRILYTSVIDTGTQESSWSYEPQAILLERYDGGDQESVVITIGGYGIGSDPILPLLAQQYNRQGNGVTVEIKDYGFLDETASASEDILAADLMAGRAPDILYGAGQTLDSYSDEKHALLLDSLIEQTAAEHSKSGNGAEDPFFSNIIDASRRDGTLLQMIPWFTVSGLMGKTSDLQDGVSFSISQAEKLQSGFPDDTYLVFANTSAAELMLYGVFGDYNRYVNMTTGEAFFTEPDFENLLNFAKIFGSDTTVDENLLMGNDRLRFINIRTLGSLTFFDELYDGFGQGATITGYPTANGQSAICIPGCALSINAATQQPEECLDFMRFLLTEDCQNQALEAGLLPIRRDILSKHIDTIIDNSNGEALMSAEAGEAFLFMLDSVHSVSRLDPAVFYILLEETAPYFAGQKSAKEICAIIQDRVSLVLKEQA